MGMFDGVSWSAPFGNGTLGAANQGFMGALTQGSGTPWGAPGDTGTFTNAAPMNFGGVALPGATNYLNSIGSGLTMSQPTAPTPGKFDPSNYKTSDYANTLQQGKQQIAEGLAQNNANTLAGQQAQGALQSGSTGLGLQQALSGAQNQNQNLASNIGQMKYSDAYNQYLGQQNAALNNYNQQMQKYGAGQQAIGQLGGAALGAFVL